MTEDIWPTIHAERAALAHDLAGLTAEQWHARSLCADWDVHQVLGHMLSSAKMTPPKFVSRFAGAGFNFDTFAGRQVERETAGGPGATLAAYRAAVQRTSSPPGPKPTWLGETMVHAEDIRRPLGIAHDYPKDQLARVLDFYSKSDTIIGGKTRIAGLTLKATDANVSVGTGPLVEGPLMSLVLAASGRSAGVEDLAGPGVATLRARCS